MYYTDRNSRGSIKILGVILFAIVVFGQFTPLLVPKAYAQLGTVEAPGPLLAATVHGAASQTVTAAGVSTQTVILQALNGLAWSVAKLAVQSITRSTVNWINSGFNGSPAFVSDLNSNLQNLSDAIAENFFTNLNKTVVDTTGFNIKSPFQDQLNQNLRAEYYRTTASYGLNYSLYQQSTNPTAFIQQGKFAQGGFNAWFSASQNPSNNPFGAYIQASNALWNTVDAAQQQRKAELGWGKGFLPWRGSCGSTNNVTTKIPEGTITTALPNVSVNLQGDSASVSLSKAEPCPFNSVKTPGSVIESQLEKNLGSGVDQLNLADSINEIVGALMGQLVNQVLGPGGLLGTSQPSSGGGTSYVTQATSPTQLSTVTTSLASGVIQNIQNDQTSITTYRDNWQKILDAANAALAACGAQDAIQTVITEATTAVAKGNAALTKLASINTEVTAAANSTSANKSTQITAALSDYESYLTSTDIPSAAEEAEAAATSTDTTGTATSTPSLYTQMINLQQSCTEST